MLELKSRSLLAATLCLAASTFLSASFAAGDQTLLGWSVDKDTAVEPVLERPLVSDRPDFTEASSTVGRGITQVEFGYSYGYDSSRSVKVRSQSLGEPLVRIGAFEDWFEFRVGLAPLSQRVSASGSRNSEDGVSDLYVGAKIALTPQSGKLPEMAVIPQFNLPTGSEEFSSDDVEPGLNLLYSWSLTDRFSMAGSTQGNRRTDGADESYVEWAQSWTVGYGLNETMSLYSEWYAFFPNGAELAEPEHYLNGGYALQLGRNAQFDIRAGVGLNDAAEDYRLGTGLVLRFGAATRRIATEARR